MMVWATPARQYRAGGYVAEQTESPDERDSAIAGEERSGRPRRSHPAVSVLSIRSDFEAGAVC